MELDKRVTRTRVCTEDVVNDSDAARLTERVDEVLEDHPAAKVIWLQTHISCLSRVRLTAVITWRD